jgi:ketosteroid isomerase-like protein
MDGLKTSKVVVAGVALVALAFAIGAVALTRLEQRKRSEIDTISRAFDQAQFRHDAATLERFLARDMLFVRGSGRRVSRREFIASFADPDTSFAHFLIRDRRIIRLGSDAAVVTASALIRGTARGRPFEEHVRYSDTFVRSAGAWQVIHVQVTPVQDS